MKMEELSFKDRKSFREWLEENHRQIEGIWIVFSKVKSVMSVKAEEALDEALCFGWIDGQIKSINDVKYMKKFTPRRKNSNWSEKNRKRALMLIDSGEMTQAGLKAVEEAKRNGKWEKQDSGTISDDMISSFADRLSGEPLALSNFNKMPLSVRRTYTAFYLDAKKEETKVSRLKKIIERLNDNLKPM